MKISENTTLIALLVMLTSGFQTCLADDLVVDYRGAREDYHCKISVAERGVWRACYKNNEKQTSEYIPVGSGLLKYIKFLSTKVVDTRCHVLDGYSYSVHVNGQNIECYNCEDCWDRKERRKASPSWIAITPLYETINCAFDRSRISQRQLGLKDSLFFASFSSARSHTRPDNRASPQDAAYANAIETQRTARLDGMISSCSEQKSLEYFNAKADSLIRDGGG